MTKYVWTVDIFHSGCEFLETVGVFATKEAAEKFVEKQKSKYEPFYTLDVNKVKFFESFLIDRLVESE